MEMRTSVICLSTIIWGIMTVSDVTSKKIKVYKKLTYAFIFVTNLVVIIFTYCLAITAIPNENLAADALKKHLTFNNIRIDYNETLFSEKFIDQSETSEGNESALNQSDIKQDVLYQHFSRQSSLFILPPLNLFILLVAGIWTFFISTRILFVIWVFYNNFIITGTLGHVLSDSVKKKFNFMLKVALVNISSSAIIIIPCSLGVLPLLILNEIEGASRFFLIICITLACYPIVNVICVVLFVGHFRNTVGKILSCLRKSTSVTVIDLRTDQTNVEDFVPNF
ncbi:hypothetical protein FO519_006930 [Halicephalobus sp. NKZ332]|nr:hypothetical protein FO519_006930 [Halicephalobus sp. NKZ332]